MSEFWMDLPVRKALRKEKPLGGSCCLIILVAGGGLEPPTFGL